ncbi:MAG TPA: pilus assembly protein PilM [Polyangia bacterium]|jgi:general secretion pathway protein L
MAQKVLGVDLGAYSVKVAVLETSFRQATLVAFHERPLPPGDETALVRGARVLGELLAQQHLGDAIAYAAIPGDRLSLRVLELPFTDEKKLEQVVGYELESQIPHAIEDVVLDHQIVASGEGAKVLTAAARREVVREVLTALEGAGAAPRALYAAPLVYAAVAARALPHEPGPVAVVDIGHLHTNVCISRAGKVMFGRTLSRGGRHLTLALAQTYQMRAEDAEQSKLTSGAVSSQVHPLPPDWSQLDAVLKEALAPLVRELRQTFAFYRAQFGDAVGSAHLCGGTARLPGLAEYLAQEVGVPVRHLEFPGGDLGRLGDAEVARPSVPLALAIGAAGATGRHALDFRKGEFGYRVDYSFVRAKAFHLAACFLAVLAFAAVDAYAALHKLRREEAALETKLKSASIELFGKEARSPKEVSREIRAAIKGSNIDLPLPESTAYDLLDDISRKLPTGEDKKLDVLELDIKPKKTFIKGTIASAAAVDEIVTALKTITCFEDIQKGPIQNVVGQDVKQFTLTIVGKCP